jgi:hypothetical protein
MATTKPDVKYVTIEKIDVWYQADTGQIHITTRDPDAAQYLRHTTVSNKEDSVRHHPTLYRDLARLLVANGKEVPGWTKDGPATG